MTSSADRPEIEIEIEAEGRTVASAEVHAPADDGVLHSDLHAESGQLPPGTRSRLVDAVLDSSSRQQAERLVATMPKGDTEMLDRVRERCDDVEAHAAGSTKIVEATLPPGD
jgi:hypothetical protein